MTVAARLRLSSDFEVGAAAFIHPNSVLVASPGAPENAGRAAALANQSNFSARALGAVMASPVAGLAIEVLNESVAVTATITITITITIVITVAVAITITIAVIIAVTIIRTGYKFGSASPIHPNTAPVIAPCPSRNTGSVAALAVQADAAARIGAAIIAPPVVRSAIYLVAVLRSRVGKTAAENNYRQQSREYAHGIARECS